MSLPRVCGEWFRFWPKELLGKGMNDSGFFFHVLETAFYVCHLKSLIG